MIFTLHTGDVSAVVRRQRAGYFDACFCDPPYGLGFMGKAWDHGVPSARVWKAMLRVLKPGAPILAFGGTRTYHRLVCAMEDAGCEIRDQIDWLFGSGFPKSLDVSKAIDAANGDERPVVRDSPFASRRVNPNSGALGLTVGAPGGKVTSAASAASAAFEGYGTALKPSHEPICLARKALDGTVAQNALAHGVGGLNVDGCRIGYASESDKAAAALPGFYAKQDIGRWPTNVIIDDAAAAEIDAQSGNRPGLSGGGVHRADYAGGMFGGIDSAATARGDSGGASRFFYIAKASRFERDFGCEHFRLKSAPETVEREEGTVGMESPRAGAGRTTGARNHHPTVKPIKLTQYLARLLLPPPRVDGEPRRLLVPFSGVGSEVIGALRAGWDEVHGIELDPEYVAIAEARIARWMQVRPEIEPDELERVFVDPSQGSLF
jgi:site-specific DNA-methyltransferase (adenine-specific)